MTTQEKLLQTMQSRRCKYFMVTPYVFTHNGKAYSNLYISKRHPTMVKPERLKLIATVETTVMLYKPYIRMFTRISETPLPFILPDTTDIAVAPKNENLTIDSYL